MPYINNTSFPLINVRNSNVSTNYAYSSWASAGVHLFSWLLSNSQLEALHGILVLLLVASHQLVHKRVEALQFFHVFKTICIISLRRDEMLTWLIFHLFGNLSDNNLTTILLVYHLSILRYFQFNEVSQGWRCLRISMPTDQVPCKTIGISNLHCALHTHMLTNAKSVLTSEIGVIPW